MTITAGLPFDSPVVADIFDRLVNRRHIRKTHGSVASVGDDERAIFFRCVQLIGRPNVPGPGCHRPSDLWDD